MARTFEKLLTLKLKVLKNAFGTRTLKPYRSENTHLKAAIKSSEEGILFVSKVF
jgi:hypothetical protein